MGICKTLKSTAAAVGAVGLGLGLVITEAAATEGYFQIGYGARQKALAGAGAADGRDAMTMALNPAGLVNVEGETVQAGLSLFSPIREMSNTTPAFSLLPLGTTKSKANLFLIPNFAYSRQIDSETVVGIAAYGNGGMNTSYPAIARTPANGPCPGFAAGRGGVFCGGKAGVDLNQLLIAPTYARSFMDRFSIGISPIFALQIFSAKGLTAFNPLSSDPARVSGKGADVSYGGGVKVGAQFAITDFLRVGGFYQSRIYMSRFEKYAGLFAEKGDFDIPQNFQVGVAVDPMPDLTVMADYKRIYYSDIKSVNNSSASTAPLGTSGGAGFGWQTIGIYKIGAEYRATDYLTLRAGYAYNENPISGADVGFNILAPGVVKHHITAGFGIQVHDGIRLDVAGTYVPSNKVTGPDTFVSPLAPPGTVVGTTEIKMHQYDVKVELTFDLGGPAAPSQ